MLSWWMHLNLPLTCGYWTINARGVGPWDPWLFGYMQNAELLETKHFLDRNWQVIMLFTWFLITYVSILTSDASTCCHQQLPQLTDVLLMTLEKTFFKVSWLRWIIWASRKFQCHEATPVCHYTFFKGCLLPSSSLVMSLLDHFHFH